MKSPHLLINLGLLHNLAELFKTNLPIKILVSGANGHVNNLLDLEILQVVSHHRLEHLEELHVGDKAVVVNVVDPEGKPQFLFLVLLGAQLRQTHDKLTKLNLSTLLSSNKVDNVLRCFLVLNS